MFVKPGAQVRYASVHHMADNIIDLTIRRAMIENDARMEWIIGDLHDGNILSDTNSILKGKGSTSDAKVISVGTEFPTNELDDSSRSFRPQYRKRHDYACSYERLSDSDH